MIGLAREFIGSDRITDIKADGTATHRVQPVPCIRMKHEKSNNTAMFESILLRMNSSLNFEVVEETMTPEQQEQAQTVKQALTDLGKAGSQKELIETYVTLAGTSPATARRHIKMAVDNKIILMKSILNKGKHGYKYSLIKE